MTVSTELMQLTGIGTGGALGPSLGAPQPQDDGKRPSDILDATTHELKLEKSNILMLGPTGSGKCIYLEYMDLNWEFEQCESLICGHCGVILNVY